MPVNHSVITFRSIAFAFLCSLVASYSYGLETTSTDPQDSAAANSEPKPKEVPVASEEVVSNEKLDASVNNSEDSEATDTTLDAEAVSKAESEVRDEETAIVEAKAEEPPKINIWEYEIIGNSLLNADDIEKTVRFYLGPDRSFYDIQAAADALEKAYIDLGYHHVLVTVPQQDVVGGLVQLQVIEGKLGRVKYTNSSFNRISMLKDKFPSVEENTTLNIKAFQEDMSKANSDSSFVSVVPVFKPGKELGLVDLDLKVQDKLPIQTVLELNNYSSGSTSPLRLDGKVSYGNLWQSNHSLSLQAQVSPENRDEVEVYSATYILPAGQSSNKIALYGVSTNSDVSSVGGISVLGAGDIYGVRLVSPLSSTQNWMHSLSVGIDYKDFKQNTLNGGLSVRDVPIDYMLFDVNYNVTVRKKPVTYKYTLAWSTGLRGFFNNEEEFARKRFKAQPNFNVLQGSVLRLANLNKGWRMKTTFDFQLADTPLINNEKISAGGVKTVRGYNESQALGDEGFIVSLEGITPNLVDPTPAINRLKFSSYFDWAHLTVKHALGDETDHFTLFSWGVGMRTTMMKEFKLAADLGVPLTDVGDDVEAGDYQFHLSFKWQR